MRNRQSRYEQRPKKAGPYATPTELKEFRKGAQKAVTRYVTLLSCKHAVYYDPPPSLTDVVYCRRCGDYRGVMVTNLEWSIYCGTCNMRRRYGTDEATARLIGAKHTLRYSNHEVNLYHGYRLIAVLGVTQPGIPDLTDKGEQ